VDAGTAGITPQNVAGLQLKWVFDYPGATRARSQPTVDGNTVYVGSQSGTVHAIDLHSGCLHWAFKADTEVRAAVSIDHGTAGAATVLYVGDTNGNLYALNAKDGSLRWRSSLADHKDVTITGPDIAENGAVVPVGCSSTLPGVKRLMILVEKNPSVLAAVFDLADVVPHRCAYHCHHLEWEFTHLRLPQLLWASPPQPTPTPPP
jgi:glucose dehydrogenase